MPAYTQHLDLILDHFQPTGYLEEVLTERVANLLWRIGRVARYEQAVIKRHVDSALRRDGVELQDVLDDISALSASSQPDAQELLADTRDWIQQLVALSSLPADLVDKVPRYEAHLDRALQRTLNQLRDLQAARRQFVPQSRSSALG